MLNLDKVKTRLHPQVFDSINTLVDRGDFTNLKKWLDAAQEHYKFVGTKSANSDALWYEIEYLKYLSQMKENKMLSKKEKFLVKEYAKKLIGKRLTEAKMSDAVRELTLFAENDSKMYDVLMKTYLKPLLAKLKQGKYDGNLAIKLLEYYYQQYVRPEYKRVFGDVKLDPSERKEFGAYFVDVLQETDEFQEQLKINDSKSIPYKLL